MFDFRDPSAEDRAQRLRLGFELLNPTNVVFADHGCAAWEAEGGVEGSATTSGRIFKEPERLRKGGGGRTELSAARLKSGACQYANNEGPLVRDISFAVSAVLLSEPELQDLVLGSQIPVTSQRISKGKPLTLEIASFFG